ncbi:MAG TPA: LON peptidase substrate-binding domain-containing protein [Anaerolineae bacterium]|nr:LON peptidase substrate-binding domain-containing protein [Anaerolineae bacterium]
MTEIPIFPLRSVLCPGVALPLHIFEERYRLMIGRCIERGEPFGVVLLRDGPEVGPLRGHIAAVGTTAAIRRAGAYPDGRLDILTVGQQRFRLEDLDNVSEPYLLGRVSLLDEPTGPEPELHDRAQRVGQHFLEYLELLQPADDADGPEIEIEFEIEMEEGAEPDEEDAGVAEAPDVAASGAAGTDEPDVDELGTLAENAADVSPEQRRRLLMAAARRLIGTDDPTALSYVLTALIQVDLGVRQELLEAPDTLERLAHLDGLLTRESWFLRQGLRPIIIDAGLAHGRRG